ncbi:FAD-binding PCMH-type domain-containing protein [Psidium guajava]|nr:FAD-binding PCMH-type domain-containing protein [Psidium guajava]
MATPQPQQNLPPPGYPTENPPTAAGGKKKRFARSTNKGERGFIEGCLFALCCCWICEECCC